MSSCSKTAVFAVCRPALAFYSKYSVTNSNSTFDVWLGASWPTDTKALLHPFHTKFRGSLRQLLIIKFPRGTSLNVR